MSHSGTHQMHFSSPEAATEKRGGRQRTGSIRTREEMRRKGLTRNTSGHLSSIIMPPWSQHFSQSLLVPEPSIHPPTNREVNNEGWVGLTERWMDIDEHGGSWAAWLTLFWTKVRCKHGLCAAETMNLSNNYQILFVMIINRRATHARRKVNIFISSSTGMPASRSRFKLLMVS